MRVGLLWITGLEPSRLFPCLHQVTNQLPMLRPEESMAAVMTIPALMMNMIDCTPQSATLKHRCNCGMRAPHAEAQHLAVV
jgi:hypothetical protein